MRGGLVMASKRAKFVGSLFDSSRPKKIQKAPYSSSQKAVLTAANAAQEEVIFMAQIRLNIDERFPLDKVLKKFKRLCDAYGIVQEYRARSEYKKPSVVKKEKLENAQKRRRKTEGRSKKFSSKM